MWPELSNGFIDDLEAAGTDDEARLIIALMTTWVFGFFLMWHFNKWQQLIRFIRRKSYSGRVGKSKRKSSLSLESSMLSAPLTSQSFGGIQLVKPLKINLEKIKLIDVEKFVEKQPYRRFGTIRRSPPQLQLQPQPPKIKIPSKFDQLMKVNPLSKSIIMGMKALGQTKILGSQFWLKQKQQKSLKKSLELQNKLKKDN